MGHGAPSTLLSGSRTIKRSNCHVQYSVQWQIKGLIGMNFNYYHIALKAVLNCYFPYPIVFLNRHNKNIVLVNKYQLFSCLVTGRGNLIV